MKVASFVWNFPPISKDSSGVHAAELARRIILENDNDVTLFTTNNDAGNLPTREIWRGTYIERPVILEMKEISQLLDLGSSTQPGAETLKVFGYNHASASALVRMIEREGLSFDLVTLYNWQTIGSGLIIKKVFPNIPLVFHIHSCEGESILVQNLRRITEVADLIVTVSQSMKDYLVAMGYPSERIHVVWSGCNAKWYDPSGVDKQKVESLKRSYGIKQDYNVVLFLGRLTWGRGVDKLVYSIPSVLAEFPNTKLLVIGTGELYHELVSLVSRMNMAESIIIRNEWLSTEEKVQHYGLADACVFPTLSAPFGDAALEAMAMMLPVVANSYGLSGFREQIVAEGPNQCGLYVNGKNPIDIAKGIREVLRDAKRAKKWGKNGRKRVLKNFTWEQTASATLNLYSEVIRKRGGATD